MLPVARLAALGALALVAATTTMTVGCGGRMSAATTISDSERLPACVVPLQPDPLSERGKRVHRLVDQLTDRYATLANAMTGAAGDAIRAEDLASGALAALVLESDTRAAETLLRHLAARQITDRSDARGRFASSDASPALPGEPDARTELAAVTLPLAALLKKLPTCISAPFRRQLDVTVALAIEALRKDADRVRSGSTPAWLQESVSLALLGETQGDVAAAAQGQEQLDVWRKTVSLHGVAEYDAADGYAASLDALLLGDAYLEDRNARTVCHEGAEHLVHDLAAHWFPAHAAMAGPSSRLPDTEGGEVRRIAELAGWMDPTTGAAATRAPVPLRRLQTLLAALEGAPLLDEDARAIFSVPRIVTATWEDPDRREPGRQTYTFLTPDVALGATSAAAPEHAGHTDRPLDAELAAPDARPASLTVHAGSSLLQPTLTATQARGALLVLVAAPVVPAGTRGEIVTDLALPLAPSGELVVDGRRGGAQLGLGAVLGTRAGAGGIALQLADASGCHGAPRVELRSDPEAGLAHLRIVHGDATHGACRPRATLLLVAGHAESHDELAGLMDSARSLVTERVQEPGEAGASSTALWSRSASVRIERGALHGVTLAVERRTRVVPGVAPGGVEVTTAIVRRVDGHPMTFGVLELDGKNISPFVH
jgi:hypothetical protein